MKAVIEFEVEDKEDFVKRWWAAGASIPEEDWYLLDGAYQQVPAKQVAEEVQSD
jgi:hypothetical protein